MFTFSYPTISCLTEFLGCVHNSMTSNSGFQWHGYNVISGCSDFFNIPFDTQKLIAPNDSFQVMGIDIPVLISPDKESKGTIMILAQDPLRNIKEFSNRGINLANEIIIGLPFAVQSKANRGTKVWHAESQQDGYDGIITQLLNEGYSVYLTDIRKFYAGCIAPNGGQRSTYNPGKAGDQIYRKLLFDEINIVNPTKIAAIGTNAQHAINHSYFNIISAPIVDLPHPSGRNTFWNSTNCRDSRSKANYLAQLILSRNT